MKATACLLVALFWSGISYGAEGDLWLGLGLNYESLSNGTREGGYSLQLEGGYGFSEHISYGGYFRPNFYGENNQVPGSSLRVYDLGAFVQASTEAGLYGKLQLGLGIVDGETRGMRISDGFGLSLGAGGGFLFPASDAFQIGPEVIYRHLTAGDGGDQIGVGALVAYRF